MHLTQIIKQKGKAFTLEFNPPKGWDLSKGLESLKGIADFADAINVTDMPGANLKMSSWAAAILLKQAGFNPVVQYTCRDRNKLALIGDMYGLKAFGIENMLILGGDPIHIGDEPDANMVYDLGTIDLIKASNEYLEDMCIGAAANPGADDLDKEIDRMKQKAEAGAAFFQTQAVFERDAFARFMDKAHKMDIPILAGIIPLRSAKMAEFMNKNIPGIFVPDTLIERMNSAKDPVEEGKTIAVEIAKDVIDLCQGLHFMPIRHIEVMQDIFPRLLD